MQHRKTFVTLFLLGTAWLNAAQADQVKLKNGDLITGEIVRKETDKLTFKTPYAGEINISWADIASVQSEKPVKVMMSDQSLVKGELLPVDTGVAKIVTNQGDVKEDVALKDVRYINASPDITGEGIKWVGRINAGGSATRGNTETEVLHIDAETIARSLHNRLTLGGYFNRAEDSGNNTVFNSRGYAKFDHFVSEKWYVYGIGFLENDRYRDLRLRGSLGGGSGYQVFETPTRNLSLEGGLSYVRDDYYLDNDETYPTARWAVKYEQKLFHDYVQFFHEHEALVALQQTNDVLLSSKTGFRFPLTSNLNASTQLNLNWESNPAPGSEKTDTVLLFNLGYGW